jgi:hypothetical protein
MNLFPFQKIYTKKEDLNFLLLDILNLITTKKISLYEPISGLFQNGNQAFVKVFDKGLAQSYIGVLTDEHKRIKELDYYKFQIDNSLKNYYSLRFSFGFLISDLTKIWNHVYSDHIPVPINPKFLFLYLNLFQYKKTWRSTITDGNATSLNTNINLLAQDILHGYFQAKMFVKKQRS